MSSYSNDLLAWLSLFWTENEKLTYDKLLDGYFLNEVFNEIDPNATRNEPLNETTIQGDEFVRNWEIFVNNIRVYYTDVLQQTLLVRLPSILTVYHHRTSDVSIQEINKAIFLILGAAVQCEKKEYFIQDIITRLSDESIQHGLMGFIKQITEETETVISYMHLDDMPKSELVQKLRNLTDDWESSFMIDTRGAIEKFTDLLRQLTDQQNQLRVLKSVSRDTGSTGNLNSIVGNSGSIASQQSAVELAEMKARIRKLQNELDDKMEIIEELHEDLEVQNEENGKLRDSHIKLSNEARRVRLLQDELDSQREAIYRNEQIEKDNAKLKEKVYELEYYKARCEELREDIAMLSAENQNILDKMENERSNDKSSNLENECKKLIKKVEEQNKLLNSRQDQIISLQDEIFNLHEKDSLNISNRSELEKKLAELEGDKDDEDGESGTRHKLLSKQIMEKTEDELMKLKSENRSLKAELQSLDRSSDSIQYQQENSDMSQEISQLKEKIQRLQESNKKEIERVMLEKESTQLVIREKAKLEQKIESIQENEKRKDAELHSEIETLNDTIMSLRERSEKSTDLRVKDLEQENTKLHNSFNEANQKINKMEFDLKRQTQKANRLDISLEKSQQDYLMLSKQNEQLNKELTAAKYVKSSLDDLQKRYSNLEAEKIRFESLVSQYSYQLQQSKSQDDSKLNQDLNEIMEQSQQRTEKLNERLREIEDELLKTKSEKEKLERDNTISSKKFKMTVDELEILRGEVANFNKLETKLKMAEKQNQDLEKERESIQTTNLKLEQDLKKLERDYKKLKTQTELQTTSIDKYRSQLTEYEAKLHKHEEANILQEDSEYMKKCLKKTETRLVDVEQKNRELYQQAIEEKRKCDTLRAQLLSERLEKQTIKSNLEKLKDEFGELNTMESDEKNEKIDKLEEKLNATVKETVKMKEERIQALNAKLTASIERNKELTVKFEALTKQYQSLQQKYEEELAVNAVKNDKTTSSQSITTYAQYLTELKDRLIVLERQNAELSTEKAHLHTKCREINEATSSEKDRNHKKIDNLEQKVTTEMSNAMRYQIEMTTLQSQLETVREENKNLSQQLSKSEKELYTITSDISGAEKQKQLLQNQCDSLKDINDKLSKEYEGIKFELNHQKVLTKNSQNSLMTSEKELNILRKDAESVKQLKEILESEKGSFADSARYIITIRQENQTLSTENHELLKAQAKFESQVKQLNQENKSLKSEKKRESDQIDKLREDNRVLSNKRRELENEIIKLEEKLENLSGENERLYNENQKLLQQMRSMLTQNHELLSQTLHNKTEHYNEENHLKDRLNQLQRQKERLEEKIMEQYKYINPVKKSKGRNKFLRKARDLLKRRDSKSNLTEMRKSPVDVEMRAQRSRSCVSMFENGDLSSTWFDIDADASASPVYSTEQYNTLNSNRRSIPNTTPTNRKTPQYPFETGTLNSDNNSLLSSLAIAHGNGESTPKLLPGSMSIYDRDPTEINQVSEMANWLNQHGNSTHSNYNTTHKSQSFNLMNSANNHQSNKPPSPNLHNSYQASSGVNKYINKTRSQSVLDKPKYAPNNDNQMTMYSQQVVRTVGKDNRSHLSSIPSQPIKFGNISSRETPTNPPAENQPQVPLRKASLPFTDRRESEIYLPNQPITSPEPAPSSISIGSHTERPVTIGSGAPQTRKPLVNPQPVPLRSSSVAIPNTASSKDILKRMKASSSSTSSSVNQQPVRNRAPTPTSEFRHQAQSKSSKSNAHRNSSTTPIRPATVLGNQMTGPAPPIRRESAHNTKPIISSGHSTAPRKSLPQVPRSSSNHGNNTGNNSLSINNNQQNSDNSSSKSDISDHLVLGRKNQSQKSSQQQQKQQIFYEYGNV